MNLLKTRIRAARWAVPFALPITLFSFATDARAEGEWDFTFAPYIWGAGLDGKTGIGPLTGEVDLSFGDILETLDGGFLGHFEAEKGRWTVLSDIVFLDVGQDLAQPNGTADVKQTIFELAAAFEASEDLEFLFGARLVDIGAQLDLFGPVGVLDARIDVSESWTDPFIGGRWSPELSDRWSFRARADVGGFGVGSETTMNVALTFLYEASEKVTVGLGYRIMDIDYDEEGLTGFVYDAQLPGALLGVGFKF